jgi:hypothetical protein
MPSNAAFVANVANHGIHVKDKSIDVALDHKTTFIDLCHFFMKMEHCQFLYTLLTLHFWIVLLLMFHPNPFDMLCLCSPPFFYQCVGLLQGNIFYTPCHFKWHTPKPLDGFNYESKGENNGRWRSWNTLPTS